MPQYRVKTGGFYDGEGREVEVGTELTLKADFEDLPLEFRNKVEVLGSSTATGALIASSPEAATQMPSEKKIEEMTVAELEQFAADKGIDLVGSTKKADIFAKVSAWVEAKKNEQPADEPDEKIDRAQLEASAKTLDIQFDETTTDEELLQKVKDALGD